MYQALFFDVDDTLLDFKKGQHNALKKMFASQGVEMTSAIKSDYLNYNQKLWTDYEEGKIAREALLAERFTYIFGKLNIVCDGLAMDRIFRNYLNEEAELLEGAREVLESLQINYPLYIVTNGVAETQKRRLSKSDLTSYFTDIFISEETGYQKPMPEFFDYVFEKTPDLEPTQCLIIGDSLSADIKGGQLAGMATCWLNPAKQPIDLTVAPTYEIQSIKDLLKILN